MRAKPKNPSAHHGTFGRMRLRYEGLLRRGNGAQLHLFEIRDVHSRWASTALGKLQTHLSQAGYGTAETSESLDNQGVVHARAHVFRRDDDEVHVRTYVSRCTQEERVHEVAHYPDGTAGDGRNRLTLNQVISAMSWGMAAA